MTRIVMLRFLVFLLFIANLLFYAWSLGWLKGVTDSTPKNPHEPQRLIKQLHPERIKVLPPTVEASQPVSPASSGAASIQLNEAPTAAQNLAQSASIAPAGVTPIGKSICLQAGPYTLAQREGVESALKQLEDAQLNWSVQTQSQPGSWMIYMGPYTNEEVARRKEEEIQRTGIPYLIFKPPSALGWGFSLGQFDQRERAMAAFTNMGQRGVRSARILTLKQPDTRYTLQFDAVDEVLRAKLIELPAILWKGHQPVSCTPSPP